MVGTNFKPSFEMFRNLTKEDILNAPSVPLERLKKECEPLREVLRHIRQEEMRMAEKNG